MINPEEPVARVLATLTNVKENGAGWIATCPAHDDHTPSLSIAEGREGRAILKCHAGCDTDTVLAALGLAMRDLFPESEHLREGGQSRIVAEYHYHNADGAHLYDVVRYSPKGFRQRAASGEWSMRGVRRVPYRLPQLVAAVKAGRTVFVVEGEKDADSLGGLCLVATTNPGGAGKWLPDFDRHFEGARVVVLPDNDDPGRDHAQDVARHVLGVAKEVRIIELPGLPTKGDVSDWLGAGGTVESLKSLVRATPALSSPPESRFVPKVPIVPPASPDDEVSIVPAPALDPGALYGPVGDWVRLMAPHTEAAPAALLACALVAIGALVGRSPYVTLDRARHGLNLNVLIIGATSGGRKGTAFANARHLMRALDSDFHRTCVTNGLSSGEGLIHAIRDPGTVPEGKKKRADPGVLDKRLLVVEHEFAGVLRQQRRDGNTLSGILREAWDGFTLRTLTKTNGETATDPHVAVIGMITPEELRRHLDDSELFNGFVNRFLLVWSERARYLPFGSSPDSAEERRVFDEIGRACVRARVRGQISEMTPRGRDWWRDHYPELTDGKPGRVGAALQRGPAQVRRVALLYTALDDAPATDVRHLVAADLLWRYVGATAEFVLGRSDLSERAKRLEVALLTAGPAGLDRTTIRKDVFSSNNVPSREIVNVLHELQNAGTARMRPSVPSDGRPPEVWIHSRHVEQANLTLDGNDGNDGNEGASEGGFLPIAPTSRCTQ